MRWLTQLRMRILMLFGRNSAATHLDDELSFHLERQIAENIAAGMTPDEARMSPLSASSAIPRFFAIRHAPPGPGLPSNPSFAICASARARSLRAPGFTLIAILVMALGIGANVALFTIVRGVLLKPLPYADSGRLIMLYESEHARFRQSTICARRSSQLLRLAEVPTGIEQMAMVSPFQSYNVFRRRRQTSRANRGRLVFLEPLFHSRYSACSRPRLHCR